MKILSCCKETHGSVAAQLEETQPLRRSDKANEIDMKLPLAKLPLNYMDTLRTAIQSIHLRRQDQFYVLPDIASIQKI